MAVPVIASSSKGSSTDVSCIVNSPAGVQDGDLLVAWLHSDKIANGTVMFDAYDDDWQTATSVVNSGGAEGAVGQIWYKIANAEDSVMPFIRVMGTGDWGVVIMRIIGVSGDPINAIQTAISTANQGLTPAVTTTVDECLIIRATSWNNAVTLTSIPTDTIAVQHNDLTSNDGHVVYENKLTAGAVSSKSYVLSANTQTANITLAINPTPPATPMENDFEAQALIYKTGDNEFTAQAKIGVPITPYFDEAEFTANAFIEKAVREQFTAQAFILSLNGFQDIASRHLRKITQSFTMDWDLDGDYTNESDNVLVLEVERRLNEPLGGISQAMADVTLDNTDNRYTPNYEDEP